MAQDVWFMFTSRNIPMESQNSPLHREIFQTSIFGLLCRWSPCCYAGATLQLVSMKRISNEIQQGVVRYSTCRELRIPKQAIPRLSRIFLVPVEKPMEIDHSCIKAAPADSSKTCSKCVFSAKQVSFQASERLTKLNSKKYKQSRKQVNEEDIWTCRVLLSIHYWMMMWHILPSFRSWWSLSMELRM